MEKSKQFVTHTLNTECKYECAEAVIMIYLQITFHQTHLEINSIKTIMYDEESVKKPEE